MIEGDDLREKKLRGSGGYAFAKITEEEQRNFKLSNSKLEGNLKFQEEETKRTERTEIWAGVGDHRR